MLGIAQTVSIIPNLSIVEVWLNGEIINDEFTNEADAAQWALNQGYEIDVVKPASTAQL